MSELGKSEPVLYKERVLPNFGTFVAVSAFLPSAVIVSEPFDINVGLIIGSLGVSAIWALLILKAPLILVTETLLRVGRASIPKEQIGTPVVVSKDEIFAERGPKLNPAAYRSFQGSVKTAIRVPLNDPGDPTPYWLFSTRQPSQLVEALKK